MGVMGRRCRLFRRFRRSCSSNIHKEDSSRMKEGRLLRRLRRRWERRGRLERVRCRLLRLRVRGNVSLVAVGNWLRFLRRSWWRAVVCSLARFPNHLGCFFGLSCMFSERTRIFNGTGTSTGILFYSGSYHRQKSIVTLRRGHVLGIWDLRISQYKKKEVRSNGVWMDGNGANGKGNFLYVCRPKDRVRLGVQLH